MLGRWGGGGGGGYPWASNWILLAHVSAVCHVLAFDFLWDALGFTVSSRDAKREREREWKGSSTKKKKKKEKKKKHPRTVYQRDSDDRNAINPRQDTARSPGLIVRCGSFFGGHWTGSKDESHHRGIPVRDKHRLRRANREGRRAGLRFPVRFSNASLLLPGTRGERREIVRIYECLMREVHTARRAGKQKGKGVRPRWKSSQQFSPTDAPFRAQPMRIFVKYFTRKQVYRPPLSLSLSLSAGSIAWNKGKLQTLPRDFWDFNCISSVGNYMKLANSLEFATSL